MPAVAYPLQRPLPQLFPPAARRAHLSGLTGPEAVRVSSEALMRTLNAIAFDPRSRTEDTRVTKDRRFSVALTVAVPLSLSGRPARPERLSEVARRVDSLIRDMGVLGPCGRALRSAQLLVRAASSASDLAVGLATRALDCAVEAEVLAAVLQDGDIGEARQRRSSGSSTSATPVPDGREPFRVARSASRGLNFKETPVAQYVSARIRLGGELPSAHVDALWQVVGQERAGPAWGERFVDALAFVDHLRDAVEGVVFYGDEVATASSSACRSSVRVTRSPTC